MSQMPSKIWLHKDTKYSTGDIVCGYQYDFVQGIEDEGGIENFVEYVPADAFIEKALKFLDGSIPDYIELKHANVDTFMDVDNERFIKDFINFMKGE